MRILRRCLAEFVDLFVDDVRFTLAIVAWVGCACALLGGLVAGTALAAIGGPILFAGIAIILLAMS